jgi:hypothetical protein
MTPGHNNAIYCYVWLNGVKQEFRVGIFKYWDQAQSKYKYGLDFILGAANPNDGAEVLPQVSNNAYWQVELGGKDACTVGESLAKAATTNAIVIVQTVNPNLPSQ